MSGIRIRPAKVLLTALACCGAMLMATFGSMAVAWATHVRWFPFVPALWLVFLFLVGAGGGWLGWLGPAEASVGGGLYLAAVVVWILVAAPRLGYHVMPAPVGYFGVLAAVCVVPPTAGAFVGRLARRAIMRRRA